jgi:serine/threonine-protein kinase
MAKLSADQLAERAVDLDLLTERQIQELWTTFPNRSPTADEFMRAVVSRELMTNYQLDRVIRGERTGFFYGEYKVLYLVGTGTFARVFRAVHRDTGQVAAIKALRQRYSENPAQFQLFLREGELGCTLRHPNIVPIYEVHSHRNTHFLVLEFVEGRSLREFIKIRKSIDPVEATRLMIDIAGGLNYAFQRAVTHRDLKASNVLVSSRGQAKIVDFGLAAMDEALAEDDVDLPHARTIDYAALERATCVRKDDPRSDIFFAGCIYYHMLGGKPPLVETTDRVQRLSKQRFFEIPPIQDLVPNLPPVVDAVLQKAMAFEPEYRYQTARDLLTDLQRAQSRLTGADGGEPASGEGGGEPEQRSVMVVESSPRMQDLLREGLKKAGFRVMVTANPERAFERAGQEPNRPDCFLFCAQEIGEPALETFNRLAADEATQNLPAILLLNEAQDDWVQRAKTSDRRVVLGMPITMKQLRAALEKVLAPRTSRT